VPKAAKRWTAPIVVELAGTGAGGTAVSDWKQCRGSPLNSIACKGSRGTRRMCVRVWCVCSHLLTLFIFGDPSAFACKEARCRKGALALAQRQFREIWSLCQS
jgi:hypothetical protein